MGLRTPFPKRAKPHAVGRIPGGTWGIDPTNVPQNPGKTTFQVFCRNAGSFRIFGYGRATFGDLEDSHDQSPGECLDDETMLVGSLQCPRQIGEFSSRVEIDRIGAAKPESTYLDRLDPSQDQFRPGLSDSQAWEIGKPTFHELRSHRAEITKKSRSDGLAGSGQSLDGGEIRRRRPVAWLGDWSTRSTRDWRCRWNCKFRPRSPGTGNRRSRESLRPP